MAVKPLAVHDLAEDVLMCVCVALDQAAVDVPGQPGCPDCRACLVPGTVAWDSCEDPCAAGPAGAGGQLTVNVARMYPSTSFPVEDREVRGLRGCTLPTYTAVELVITLLRCVPGPDEGGCPPTCEELAAAARVLHVDLATVYNALLCCLPGTAPNPRGRRYVIGTSKTIGPEGGCVGLEQRVTVALYGCSPCPGGETS
ncbi:hypothetical protein [Streptomyces sp. G1]|uniref:hypothetical protein n=1 Tax=Streptomyces sp. G1 TaxID=361572 RepID=UPI00202E76CC|nr:hypothetical protein [Streptomyces sp. G1]MCM1964833.1 hypothetical protein [Streptomyces sp. G1]